MREEMRGGVWKGRERGERRMERREKLLRERDRGWGRGWRGRLPCLELQKMYMYTYIVHVHVCNILVLHKYALFFHFQKQELAGGAKAARIYRDEVETLKVQV